MPAGIVVIIMQVINITTIAVAVRVGYIAVAVVAKLLGKGLPDTWRCGFSKGYIVVVPGYTTEQTGCISKNVFVKCK